MVHGAKVDGELDLSYVTVPFPIRLWFCALTNDAHLRSMQIPELDLQAVWCDRCMPTAPL